MSGNSLRSQPDLHFLLDYFAVPVGQSGRVGSAHQYYRTEQDGNGGHSPPYNSDD